MWVTRTRFFLLDSYNNQIKSAPRPFTEWTVLAGNGSRPARGRSDDGPALAVALNEPHGMAVVPSSLASGDDADVAIYVAEMWPSCVWLLRARRLATVAGTCGVGGYADVARDGVAAAARFQHPHHVALDPRDEAVLYLSDAECYDDDGASAPRVLYFALPIQRANMAPTKSAPAPRAIFVSACPACERGASTTGKPAKTMMCTSHLAQARRTTTRATRARRPTAASASPACGGSTSTVRRAASRA